MNSIRTDDLERLAPSLPTKIRTVPHPAEVSISVVVVAHNPAAYLVEMLESLVNQIEPADEIIYYDDCSNDGSMEIIESYRGKLTGLRTISGKKQIGVSAARNFANSLARSEYIAVLDSDDLFLEDTLLNYRARIRQDESIDLLYADTIVFNNRTKKRTRRRYPFFTRSSWPVLRLMARPILPFKHSSVLYRKSKVDEIGGYREDIRLKVDFEIFIRFIRSDSRIAKLDQATSLHRTHEGQMSRERLKGIAFYWKIIDIHEHQASYALILKLLRATGELAKMIAGR